MRTRDSYIELEVFRQQHALNTRAQSSASHLDRQDSRTTMAARATRRTAYVGSYTGFDKKGQLGWVGTPNAGKGISIFEFDEDKGTLTPTGRVIEQVSSQV